VIDVEALLAVADANRKIVELLAGYRNMLEQDGGFSPTAAEMMAAQYHDALVRRIWSS